MNNQLHRRQKIHQLQPHLVQWRRHIHQHPELSFQEHQTANFISQKLTEWGINHQTGIAKTGIIAQIEGTKPSANAPNLAIRADMDALPILEENSVPYQSQHHGIMHACGHDGHTAILLGTAYYLAHHRDNFSGTIKLIFQPAEEGLGGAKAMIEAGVLENVAAIIGLHLWNNLPLGTVGVRHGTLMAASEAFCCQIFGKGGHGGMPHQTVDAVVVGAHIIQALQTIISRNIDPLDAAVITVGELHAGTKQNVIAATAQLSGTVRYLNPALTQFIPQRLEQIIAGICQIHGADYELDYKRISPPLVNEETITNLLHSVAETVVTTPTDVISDCQTLASEDMAYFLQKIPGCFFFLGSANPETGFNAPHHHPQFDFDETALPIGVEVFVRFVEAFCG